MREFKRAGYKSVVANEAAHKKLIRHITSVTFDSEERDTPRAIAPLISSTAGFSRLLPPSHLHVSPPNFAITTFLFALVKIPVSALANEAISITLIVFSNQLISDIRVTFVRLLVSC